MQDESAIRYSLGIGAFPWVSFGSLTLTDEALTFRPHAFIWTSPLNCIPIEKISSAQVVREPHGVRRRLMWILSALFLPLTGFIGIPWFITFWPRAGDPTLEVSASPWLFGRTRVYIVGNPQEWAAAINRFLEEPRQVSAG